MSECDREASIMGRPWPNSCCWATKNVSFCHKNRNTFFLNIRSGVFKISSGENYTHLCKRKQINIQKTKYFELIVVLYLVDLQYTLLVILKIQFAPSFVILH